MKHFGLVGIVVAIVVIALVLWLFVLPVFNKPKLADANTDGSIDWHDADVNNDGKVDVRDLAEVVANIGSENMRYDLNGDGKIDNTDVSLCQAYFMGERA